MIYLFKKQGKSNIFDLFKQHYLSEFIFLIDVPFKTVFCFTINFLPLSDFKKNIQ